MNCLIFLNFYIQIATNIYDFDDGEREERERRERERRLKMKEVCDGI
jgi:hypothetical protein